MIPPAQPDDPRAFHAILSAEYAWHPLLGVRDLYKLVYQAALGCEHAVTDAAAARAWLVREVETLQPMPGEPLAQPISPDGQIMRVHLRPWLARGYAPEALLEAFVQSAAGYRGTLETLETLWQSARGWAENEPLPFAAPELDEFTREMRALNFPPVHHSARYAETYRPAYRVIVSGCLPANLPLA